MTPIYFARVVLLAALYVLTGKLGLVLAVPPGLCHHHLAALGNRAGHSCSLHGARLWPGVLLGSFLLNAFNSGVFAEPDWASSRAARRVLHRHRLHRPGARRARAGRALHRAAAAPRHACATSLRCSRSAGRHLRDRRQHWRRHAVRARYRDRARARGELAGLVVGRHAGRAGVHAAGAAGAGQPRTPHVARFAASAACRWRRCCCCCCRWASRSTRGRQRPKTTTSAAKPSSTTLTIESEKALQNRLASYGNALLGAAGFIQGSIGRVARGMAHLRRHHPGAREFSGHATASAGCSRSPTDSLPEFLAQVRADGAPDFTIHPQAAADPTTSSRYIEPEADNRPAHRAQHRVRDSSAWPPPRWRATRDVRR